MPNLEDGLRDLTNDEPVDESAELPNSEQPDREQVLNHYREAARRALGFYQRFAMFVKGYRGDPMFAFDCGLLAMGWYDILGCSDEVELGKVHGVTKANVSKCVKMIQKRLDVEPMPGQRTLAACKKFAAVRKSQLQ